MAYVSREIKDRVAIGDNCFYMEELEDGRIMLTPAPTPSRRQERTSTRLCFNLLRIESYG